MSGGIQTCPVCGMRVLPGDDNRCPACRGYDFSSGAVCAEIAAKEVAKRPPPDALRRVARLHWSMVSAAGALILLLLARFAAHAAGRHAVNLTGIDYGTARLAIAIGVILAAVALGVYSTRLRSAIGLERSYNPIRLLKESNGYFDDHGVAVGFLGPSMADIDRKMREADRSGRPTRA